MPAGGLLQQFAMHAALDMLQRHADTKTGAKASAPHAPVPTPPTAVTGSLSEDEGQDRRARMSVVRQLAQEARVLGFPRVYGAVVGELAALDYPNDEARGAARPLTAEGRLLAAGRRFRGQFPTGGERG